MDKQPVSKKIYFWEKFSTRPDNEKLDKLIYTEVEDDPSIREVIRSLEEKMIGSKKSLSEITPNNPSVKKWIKNLLKSYPQRSDDNIEYLINEFRSVLHTKSKEKERFIVCILQLNDVLVIAHCRKERSLAELEDKIYSVKTVLHPKNIIRADILKEENGSITLSAFEYNRRWSKGHASFWGIEIDDVSWESLGNISLGVELKNFDFPIQIPIEQEQLREMIDSRILSASGNIKVGKNSGKVTKVSVYGKEMDYSEFYDYFVTESEKLDTFKKKFNELVPKPVTLDSWREDKTKYKYLEDEKSIYLLLPEGEKRELKKEHPRFNLSFFTRSDPGIKPKEDFLWKIYESIFESRPYELWHAGEQSTNDPKKIGSLEIYNQVEIPIDLKEFTENLLNLIQDSQSKKAKNLLQYLFCKIYKENLSGSHIKYLFDFIIDSYIMKEIIFEFDSNNIMAEKEDLIEFKSADDVDSKPTKFAKEKLTPTIKKYFKDGKLSRYCIVYGAEDNGQIKPIYNLKSDQITSMENSTNEELENKNLKVVIQQIPYKEGSILSVFLIPLTK